MHQSVKLHTRFDGDFAVRSQREHSVSWPFGDESASCHWDRRPTDPRRRQTRWLVALVAGAAAYGARWFRIPYRAAMTVSFGIGQVVGRILLAVFFVVAVLPVALVLRLLGRDLLKLKRDAGAQTYWHPAKTRKEFDRQF